MSHGRSIARRSFFQILGTAAAGPFLLCAKVNKKAKPKAANDLIAIGCIGVGGRGTANMNGLMNAGLDDARVVAVCDVDEKRRLEAKDRVEKFYAGRLGKADYKGCAMYHDFRQLLARTDIDAVMIATPDHWHVPIGIAAAEAGKDMYLEKPLGLSVAEGRALCNAVKKAQRIFQFGTQQRSDARFRQACELVRNGKIGRLETIKVGSPFGIRAERDAEAPVPPGFDYDLWLGPARKVPYTEKRTKTPYWYHISDYALGFIAGWGIHHVDIAQWGNNTDHTGPIDYEGTGDFPPKGELTDTPTRWLVNCLYANGVKLIYADEKQVRHGVTFEGTDGWVFVDRQRIEAKPESLLKWEPGPSDIHLYKSDNHYRNFLDCIQSRKETICPVETAQRSDTICQLSDITIRLKRRIRWDPEKEQILDDPEANEWLSKPKRG
ncbi:MAG: Gfo/Idh/MocA family oxidoreductase [Candidatus Sumerlaeia bacterium]|nr:Gfo/Idh/MocA family oxidoreductase [Candidatus Sumerlaeia bacterium]